MQEVVKMGTSSIEVDLKVKRFDVTSGNLLSEIDCSTKMTKVDSGKCGCGDENFNLTIEPSGEDCPRIFVNHYDKSTKADAGVTEKTK